MALRTSVDWKAVASGAVVTIAVGVLASVALNALGIDRDSNWLFLFFWIAVIGAGAGGFIAGRRRLDMPLLHGALAGLAGYAVVGVIGTAINLAAGHDAPTVIQVIFNALWLSVGGTLGGYVASWRAEKQSRPTPPSP